MSVLKVGPQVLSWQCVVMYGEHTVFNLPWVNSPILGSALIFFHYKESPARPKEPKVPRTWESVRNTPLLAAGIGWTSGDCLL